jgi:hypothetical protein
MTTEAAPKTTLQHDWVKVPCSCYDRPTECYSCSLGLSNCKACGADSETTATTDCPGEIVMPSSHAHPSFYGWRLLAAVINTAGLDVVNGEWVWKPERTVTIKHSNEVVVVEQAGSIDRLVSYAERRLEKIHAVSQ